LFGILSRPLPNLENVEIKDGAFWQVMYVLLPEITYYLLLISSLFSNKVLEIKLFVK
tara:strand:+ start:118 stop:288 length:171 start_codon:yes stop_codon:yes gene_type:complete